MRLNKIAIYIASSLLVVQLVVSPLSPVYARSLDEIQDDISQQQQELNQLEDELALAQASLNTLNNSLANTQGQIPQIKAEIEQLEANIKTNKLQLEVLNENKQLRTLEKEERQKQQEITINNSYRNWKSTNRMAANFSTGYSHIIKSRMYQAQVISVEQGGIDELAEQIVSIISEIGEFETETASLESKTKQLEQKKKDLEAQLAYLNSSAVAAVGVVAGLRTEAGILQSTLEQLSAEQKAVEQYEAWLLGQSGNGGTQTVDTGEYYFTGQGRDVAQGHGVGMSQYGAKGAADQGWTAQQILEFYYPGAQVTNYNETDKITVKYCPGSNTATDAYQDGCADGAQPVTQRVWLDSYLAGLGEMPESWPIEARKAQMIAARTYALRYTNNGDPNYPICLTTYCQVSYFKHGDRNELSLVEATAGQVVTYNGQLIETLYSADNNQGYGTADHDTRFQNIFGDQTGSRPYLKSVDDNQFAQNSRLYWNYYCPGSPCGLWSWRTNGYSLSDFDDMLNHVNNNSYYTSIAPSINAIRNDIGNVAAITFVRDGGEHVKKVRITGTTGVTRDIGGWWFKSIWNSWIYTEQPTGEYDYIYSLTYFMIQG
jgi:peptidoglycan hydrolase-like amidase